MRLTLVSIRSRALGCSSEPTSFVPSQWNVINYWAIWWPVKGNPELNQLNQIENVVVLGVNFDGKVGEALVRTPMISELPLTSLMTLRLT